MSVFLCYICYSNSSINLHLQPINYLKCYNILLSSNILHSLSPFLAAQHAFPTGSKTRSSPGKRGQYSWQTAPSGTGQLFCYIYTRPLLHSANHPAAFKVFRLLVTQLHEKPRDFLRSGSMPPTTVNQEGMLSPYAHRYWATNSATKLQDTVAKMNPWQSSNCFAKFYGKEALSKVSHLCSTEDYGPDPEICRNTV